ncbi:Fatty acid desaturase [Nitrosomonas cryotolerans]|uniref:Fatty acid desaturase n=2 Tax=Nitrosomonas cryotolerans TaxID=44575 RepID=A0A1N6G2V5_9PROT|nr:Fatty acid desaturase [Nitrosomonas cryotolerans]SIO01875.1 Fatty acid desaturase [Nitrosomonas cryotolerans ATCC 49181]
MYILFYIILKKDSLIMKTKLQLWRYTEGALPNSLAFGYVFSMQALGIYLLTSGQLLTWFAGILAMTHSLVIAAYLIHEIAHQCLFQSRKVNRIVGEVLSWICGTAYAPIGRIQRMHMRHHGDRADVTLFDPRAFLKRTPNWFRKTVYLLEWMYLPAVELIMHFNVMTRPFLNDKFKNERWRVILMGLSRLVFFGSLYILSPWALVGFAIAYLLFLTALFIADAYAHTYEFFLVSDVNEKIEKSGRDQAYDIQHTYSNLISERWPVLNLLNLNFGYHNAHHYRPAEPWYQLPELHNERFSPDSPQILPYKEIWHSFRMNRLKRIEAEEAGDVGTGTGRADGFLGVHGVSFLSVV